MIPLRLAAISVAALCLAASAAFDAAPAGAHDYVVNGSFEAGAAGWSVLSPGSVIDTEPDGVPPIAGAARARVTLAQSAFRLGQSLADVPAGDYRLSLWLYQSSPATLMYVEVGPSPAACAANCHADVPALAGAWQRVEMDLTLAVGGFVTLRIGGAGTAGDAVYVDDVRFEGAAPATMTHTPSATPPLATPTPTADGSATPPATTTPAASPTTAAAPFVWTGMLQNGGFEEVADGAPIAWAKYGGVLTSAPNAHTGAAAARLESATDATKWLYQAVRVAGGVTYEFSAWALHDDPAAASVSLRISWYATDDASGEAIGSADSPTALERPESTWRALNARGLAPPDARSARLRVVLRPGSAAPAAVFVDDAAFVEAPPDATAAAADPEPPPEAVAGASAPAASRASRAAAAPLPAGSATQPRVLINEVLYDPAADGPDHDGEWVELYNASAEPVSLEGWYLADAARAVALPAYAVSPYSYVVLRAKDSLRGESTAGVVAIGRLGNGLGNNGDLVALIDPSGRFVDAVSWGDNADALRPPVPAVPAGHSIERRDANDSDTARDFVDNEAPSPGAPYQPPTDPANADPALGPAIAISEHEPATLRLAALIAAAAGGALVAAACWRAAPVIAQRLRQP